MFSSKRKQQKSNHCHCSGPINGRSHYFCKTLSYCVCTFVVFLLAVFVILIFDCLLKFQLANLGTCRDGRFCLRFNFQVSCYNCSVANLNLFSRNLSVTLNGSVYHYRLCTCCQCFRLTIKSDFSSGRQHSITCGIRINRNTVACCNDVSFDVACVHFDSIACQINRTSDF